MQIFILSIRKMSNVNNKNELVKLYYYFMLSLDFYPIKNEKMKKYQDIQECECVDCSINCENLQDLRNRFFYESHSNKMH